MGITKILVDFNLAVWYGIAIHTYARAEEILADFNLVVVKWDRQTAKFNSLPNFLAIQYNNTVASWRDINFDQYQHI